MLDRSERIALVDLTGAHLPVTTQAALLGLNRSSLYYEPAGPSERDVAIKHRIDEIYTKCPFYGSRRISAQLKRDGWSVNRKAVQRHMREMGIEGITPGPNLSRRDQEHRLYPYLLQGVSITRPNQVWGIDITYIRLMRGWVYLVAILDWYSRYIVSWELDQSLEVGFVLSAVERAFEVSTPEIFNSDQGSQFTSPSYTDLLKAAGVQISMDGKGRAIDNIFTERLWRTVKYEEVYLHDYVNPRDARAALRRYLAFYNGERLHQALGYIPPAEVYCAAAS